MGLTIINHHYIYIYIYIPIFFRLEISLVAGGLSTSTARAMALHLFSDAFRTPGGLTPNARGPKNGGFHKWGSP